WESIVPDSYNDWLNQRDDEFNKFIKIGDKKERENTIFESYSLGIATGRDAWVYNFSLEKLKFNLTGFIDFYNSELKRYSEY
ncbi:endonuclease, partial [Escherichia coli]|nr:endonuclease [Escherichia coli]